MLLTGARWFSTLDLASGYNQVEVAEADKAKTAFCTPFGLFEVNNALRTFQRLMDKQFRSLLLYLNDIVVYSSSVQELYLLWLQQEGIKIKLSKCSFFQK